MELMEILEIVLKIGLILMVFAIFAVLVIVTWTIVTIRALIIELNNELRPVLKKLTDTVDVEITRLDEVVKAVQDISARVQVTSRVIQDIMASPLIKVAGVAAGTKKAYDSLFGRKRF